MTKNYPKKTASKVTGDELALPDAVSVAMADIAGSVKDGLLALAVAAGLQVMAAMIDESVTAVAGPKGRHQPERAAVRHGTEAGSVVLGGRRVPVRRPRVRAADRSGEMTLEAYDVFSNSDLLGDIALEPMMAKQSTRRYRAGLEPVGTDIEAAATSTSKSEVSRRFVARTETALGELMSSDLARLDVVALRVDGVHFAGRCFVVALGVGIDGTKHPVGVVEGDSENATVVKDLLVDLRDRGLDTTCPVLVAIDGAKAHASAVNAVFDHPVIQRCQLHEIRNVEAKLPKSVAKTVAKKLRAA
jgi:transposase-like protein